MKPTIRLSLLSAAVAVALAGCSSSSKPAEPDPEDFTHEVLLEVPASTDDLQSIVSAVERRLEAADVPHDVATEDERVRVSFDPGKGEEVDDELFTARGSVTVRSVLAAAEAGAVSADYSDCVDTDLDMPCLASDDEGTAFSLGEATMTSADIADTKVVQNQATWGVRVTFTDDGAEKMEQLSGDAACAEGAERRIALLVDGAVVAAPEMGLDCGESLSSDIEISGDYTREEVDRLAASMAAELPEGIQIASSRP